MKTWFLKNFVYRYHADWIDLYNEYHDPQIFEMKEWFKENIDSKRGKILTVGYNQDQFMGSFPIEYFCFRYGEDLMAFKLMYDPIIGTYPGRPQPGPRNNMWEIKMSFVEGWRFKGGKHHVVFKVMDKPINVIIWINENIPRTIVEEIPYQDYYSVKFRTQEDLMAFKLRWI